VGTGALILVPASLIVMILSRPIVAMVLQRGAFGPGATEATSAALFCYAPALFPLFVSHIALATFRGMKEFRIPLLINVISAVISVLANALLIGPFGIRGLASATTIVIVINTIIMVFFMWRRTR